MLDMYIKYRDNKPYAYMYGDETVAMALYYGDGYKTPEEALEAWEREQSRAMTHEQETTIRKEKYHDSNCNRIAGSSSRYQFTIWKQNTIDILGTQIQSAISYESYILWRSVALDMNFDMWFSKAII